VRALWQAADEDSATGGPDAVRGIFPTVATITAQGFERVPEAEVAQAFGRVISHLSSAEVNRTLPATSAGDPDMTGPSKAPASKATASKAVASKAPASKATATRKAK